MALKPGDPTAEDTEVGFVPLGHVSAEARPRLKMFGGYRTIDGGADVDAVYAFAWLNAVVSGSGVRF